MPNLKEITEWDTTRRIAERTHVSTDGRQVHVERRQRCDDIVAATQAAKDLKPGKNMRHAASVPLVLYHKWMVEAGIAPCDPDTTRKMTEVIKRKVQSNEYWRLLVHGF